jgi:hypothetical protein
MVVGKNKTLANGTIFAQGNGSWMAAKNKMLMCPQIVWSGSMAKYTGKGKIKVLFSGIFA